jgi:hypothetical protein
MWNVDELEWGNLIAHIGFASKNNLNYIFATSYPLSLHPKGKGKGKFA